MRLRSEYSVDRYFANLEESGKIFRDGWFHSGDLGRLTADGLLVITGREQAVLNLGGDKVSPELIELVLSQFPGVSEAAVFGAPNDYGNNEVWAAIVKSAPIEEQALKEFCTARI